MRRTSRITLVFVAIAVATVWWCARARRDAGVTAIGPTATVVDGARTSPASAPPLEEVGTRAVAAPTAEAKTSASSDRRSIEPAALKLVLSGVVLDWEGGPEAPGIPAPDVLVTARIAFDMDDAASARTDASGRFHMELADAGERPITAFVFCEKSENLQAGSARTMLRTADHELREIVLKRYPKGDLTGTTVDVDDQPLGGVRLVFRSQDGAVRETTSDASGAFRVARYESKAWFGFNGFEAERDGYALIEAPQPRQSEPGIWDTMRVVLAPTARMRVSVADAHDRPVVGVLVSAIVSPFERFGAKRNEHGSVARGRQRVVTDELGVARLDGVWANQRIEIELTVGDPERSTPLRAARMRDGVLILDDATNGRPIAIGANDELRLRAVIPATARIAGRVVDESGQQVGGARVSVGVAEPDDGKRHPLASALADDDGRFALEFASLATSSRMRVTALQDGFGLTGRAASRVVDLADAATEVVLSFERALSLRGRVLAPDESPVRGWVHAYDAGADPALPGRTMANISKEGAFAIEGLTAGSYDLRVRPNERWSETWVRGVASGSDGIEVRLERERAARITIEYALSEGEPGEIVVLRGRLEPRRDWIADVRELPMDSDVSALEGWPARGNTLGYGGASFFDERGRVSMDSSPQRERTKTYEMDEGDYWFGAKGRDAAGGLLFPIGTGLVHVSAGQHTIRFELTAAVPLEGRVHSNDVLDLAVAIAPRGGEPLELDVGSRELTRVRELGADGRFSFVAVPVGELEIRVGTRDELSAGNARHREPIVVKRGAKASVELHVGR